MMIPRSGATVAVLLAVIIGGVPLPSALADEKEPPEVSRSWAQWRGPLGTGVAPHGDPPVAWSELENVRWKTEIPGLGYSTPIVWGDRIFLTTAIPHGKQFKGLPDTAPGAHDNLLVTQRHRFVVICVNRKDGSIAWQQEVSEARPHEGGHTTGSLASHSPVTDGTRLFTFFGSRGLYCLDFNGKLIWKIDLGRMNSKHAHGEASSPALFGQTLVVNWDHEDQSFVVAFDTRDGKERWRINRDEVTSWASPLIVVHKGRPQAVIPGTRRLRGYDLATGKVLWECGGLSHNIIATPVAGHGMVYAGSSYETQNMMAIKLDGATGDITDSDQVAWSTRQRTPYVPSPLLVGRGLYFLRHYQGILTRLDAPTGKEPSGPFRINGISNVYASPVAAAGRIYITDLAGVTMVISSDESPRFLARNVLADGFGASAAIVGKEMFLRGLRNLYCLAEDPAE